LKIYFPAFGPEEYLPPSSFTLLYQLKTSADFIIFSFSKKLPISFTVIPFWISKYFCVGKSLVGPEIKNKVKKNVIGHIINKITRRKTIFLIHFFFSTA
jgi:hypothetical protein